MRVLGSEPAHLRNCRPPNQTARARCGKLVLVVVFLLQSEGRESNKLREHEGEDENWVPDLSLTNLVLILGSKADSFSRPLALRHYIIQVDGRIVSIYSIPGPRNVQKKKGFKII